MTKTLCHSEKKRKEDKMEKLIRWMVGKFMPGHHLKLKPVQKGPRKKRAPKQDPEKQHEGK